MSVGLILNNSGQDKQTLKLSVDLADTISTEMKNIQIKLRIENLSPEPISTKNPSHWGNVYPFIEQKGSTIPLIKVKINPEHFNDLVRLEPHQVFIVEFDYSLDELLDMKSLATGRYEIFFRLQSNPSIASNVLTFYKK